MKFFISLICLIASFISLSAQEEEKKNEVQVTTDYEVLSKNLGTWKSVSLNFRHNFSKRQVLYGFYQKAYRSDITNDTATIGYYQPLSKKHSLLVEMSASPESKFLPKWSGMAQLETQIAPATFLNTGYRRTIYKDTKVNIANVGVEKYWKSYRFVYNATIANARNLGNSFGNQVRADKYYGKRSNVIGADFAFGSEVSSVLTNGQVLKSSITSIGVGGKQMLTDSFGIHYRAGFYRQGDFYNRGGTTLGVIYRF